MRNFVSKYNGKWGPRKAELFGEREYGVVRKSSPKGRGRAANNAYARLAQERNRSAARLAASYCGTPEKTNPLRAGEGAQAVPTRGCGRNEKLCFKA